MSNAVVLGASSHVRQIDGASKWKTHFKITIPLMQENYKVSLVFCINAGLNAFATKQLMTNGGPGTATYSLSFFMYQSAFQLQKYGYGCFMGSWQLRKIL